MRRALVVSLSIAAAGTPLLAQDRATGTVAGFVVDSIQRQPLSNAFILIEGSGRSGSSDSAGTFVITNVPAGTYRAVLMHDVLDALRLSVRTGALTVTAGDTLRLYLGTPSSATILRTKCGADRAASDSSGLFGIVTDPWGAPAGGSTVLLRWRQITVSRTTGVHEGEQFRAAVTAPDGSFQICGLPDDLAAEARVAMGPDTSGTIPVRIPMAEFAVIALGLPEPATDSRRGSAVVRGRVTDAAGRPLPGAHVEVGTTGSVSDTSGQFVIRGLAAGSQTLTVRRLGYEMREYALVLRSGEEIDVEVVMPDYVPLLEEVVVRVRRDAALERVGFATRERAGSGFYVRPEEIDRRHVSRMSDYLTGAPMLMVSGSGSNRRVTGRRRGSGTGCVAYAIDGRPTTGPADEIVNPQEIGAIEVYPRGLAPAFFLGINTCEVVLIWTRAYLGLSER